MCASRPADAEITSVRVVYNGGMVPLLIVVGVSVLTAAPDTAQNERATEESELRRSAIRQQKRADALFRAGHFEQALAAAMTSYQLLPTPRTAFNVALIQSRLGRKQAAFDLLVQALDLKPSRKEHARIVGELAVLGPDLHPPQGWLRVTSRPAGARVQLVSDDRVLGHSPCAVPLPAGAHRVRLLLDGHLPVAVEVRVSPGLQANLESELAIDAGSDPGPVGADVHVGSAVPALHDLPDASSTAGAEIAPLDEEVGALFWLGAGLGGIGAIAAAAGGIGVVIANGQVADPRATWVQRQGAVGLGVGMLATTVVGSTALIGGGVLVVLSLVR